MKRKAKYARLHSKLFMGFELGDVLPPNNRTLLNFEMHALGESGIEGGLLVEFEFNKIKRTALIPAANVQFVELLPEPKSN